MSWIATVRPDDADGELRAAYDSIVSARGGIAEVHRVQSLNPRALLAHLELYKAIVFQRSSAPVSLSSSRRSCRSRMRGTGSRTRRHTSTPSGSWGSSRTGSHWSRRTRGMCKAPSARDGERPG